MSRCLRLSGFRLTLRRSSYPRLFFCSREGCHLRFAAQGVCFLSGMPSCLAGTRWSSGGWLLSFHAYHRKCWLPVLCHLCINLGTWGASACVRQVLWCCTDWTSYSSLVIRIPRAMDYLCTLLIIRIITGQYIHLFCLSTSFEVIDRIWIDPLVSCSMACLSQKADSVYILRVHFFKVYFHWHHLHQYQKLQKSLKNKSSSTYDRHQSSICSKIWCQFFDWL